MLYVRRLHGTAEESVYQTQAITKHTCVPLYYITVYHGYGVDIMVNIAAQTSATQNI